MTDHEKWLELIEEHERVHALLDNANVPGGANSREDGLSLLNRVRWLLKDTGRLKESQS